MILWKTEILKKEWGIYLSKKNIINEWPFSVVVITFALHAKGPGFEPRNDHLFLFWNSYLAFRSFYFFFEYLKEFIPSPISYLWRKTEDEFRQSSRNEFSLRICQSISIDSCIYACLYPNTIELYDIYDLLI